MLYENRDELIPFRETFNLFPRDGPHQRSLATIGSPKQTIELVLLEVKINFSERGDSTISKGYESLYQSADSASSSTPQ